MSFGYGSEMANGIEALVGEEALVSEAIPGAIHLGKVHARGEDWPALSASGDPIEKGVIVLVVEVDKGHLLVTPSGR